MKHRTSYLVVLCCTLIHMTVIGSDTDLYHTVNKDGTLAYLSSQSVAYLLYLLLGWLANVYFSRYKFVQASFITVIVATIIMIITASLSMSFPYTRAYFYLAGLSLLIGLIGIGLFESTAIQFGMDQMLEASSDQLSTFIHWYYWSQNLGQLIIICITTAILTYFSQCTIKLDVQHTNKTYNYLHPYEFTITGSVILFMTSLQLGCWYVSADML